MGTTIIHGPMASGKTLNAELLRKAYGCKHILEDWNGFDKLPRDTLVLTNESPFNWATSPRGVTIVPIQVAAANVKGFVRPTPRARFTPPHAKRQPAQGWLSRAIQGARKLVRRG